MLIAVSNPIVGPTRGRSLSIVAGNPRTLRLDSFAIVDAPLMDPSPPITRRQLIPFFIKFLIAIALYFYCKNLFDLDVFKILPPF